MVVRMTTDFRPEMPPAPAAGVVPRPPPPPPAAPERSVRHWLRLLPLVVLGAALGFAGVKFGAWFAAVAGPAAGEPLWLKLALIAWLPFVWLFAVGVHELGHLVGGWAIGGQFLLYAVGPFKWQRTPTGVRFFWNFKLNTFGGLASCLPLQAGRATPRRMAWMVAGGPLASVVLAVAAAWCAVFVTAPFAHGALLKLLHRGVVEVAVMSGVLAVATLFPSMAGGFKSDGLRLLGLLRRDRRSEQETALVALTAASIGGVRPAQLDAALIERSLALRDRSVFDLYAHFTAYLHAADRGEFARAQGHLDTMLAGEGKMMPMIRELVRAEYAWLIALQTGDAATARAWLDSAGRIDFEPATRLRAEAAVLLAEGRAAEAGVRVEEARHALLHRSMSPVRNLFAEDALDRIAARLGPNAARL